jgi:hypothetical protein
MDTTKAWTFDGYWTAVVGDVDAAGAVDQNDLVPGDFRGFSEWLGAAECAAWADGGGEGDMGDAWGTFHHKAARMLMDAANAKDGAA